MADMTRIEQFRKMAADDPGNELGHFSIGRAYLDAGMSQEAIAALQRSLEINPKLSKAYQLIGEAQLALGRREEAIATLTTGAKVANERGDLMPRNAMTAKLKELGAEVPEMGATAPQQPVGEGQVLC